jgi:hypothetical protein
MLFLRCALIIAIMLTSATLVGATPEPGTLSPYISPEECDIALPTEEEAVARLRSIGVPEHETSVPTQSEEIEDVNQHPAIPSGREVDEPALQEALVGSVRRLIACEYVDIFMTYFVFSSNEYLLHHVPSIDAFREEVAIRKSTGSHPNREVHKRAIWEVFGFREIDSDTFGLFVVQGITSDPTGQRNWLDLALFYVFSRPSDQFYLDEVLPIGRVCGYGDSDFKPDPALIPSGTVPTSDQICAWSIEHR